MAKNSYTSNPLDFAENRSHKPLASVLGIFFHLNTTETGYKYYIVCTVFVSIKQDKKGRYRYLESIAIATWLKQGSGSV